MDNRLDYRVVDSAAIEGGVAVEPAIEQPAIEEPRRLPRPPENGLARSLERWRLQLYWTTMLLDVIALLGSFALAASVYAGTMLSHDAMLPVYLLMPLFLTIALFDGCYSRRCLTRWQRAAAKLLTALIISATLLSFFAFFARVDANFSRVVFASGLVMSAVSMIGIRIGLMKWTRNRLGPSALNRLLIEAGGPRVAIPHVYRISAEDHGLEPDVGDPVKLDRLAKYLRNMDEVIVNCRDEDRLAWSEALKGTGIHGEVISHFARQIGALGIVHHEEAGISSLLISAGRLGMRQRAFKRLFDLAVSVVALLCLSPVMVFCAIAIKLEDGGPVFFCQRRMGRGNQFFNIYKFRSMRESDADGNRSASREDDRITRIGRFMRRTSIDELPQVLNVILGDMSIVGPRPHALGSLAGSKMFWQVDRKYWQRHSLRPGITGLAQVRGYRGATDEENDLVERLRADLEYLNRWSFWLDVKIVFATLRVLVHSRAF